jgi:transposase-like protein
MSRRKICDDDEKRRLVAAWDESGLNAAEFAAARGIHAETLRLWGRRIRGPLRRQRSRTRPVTRNFEVVEVGSVGPTMHADSGRRIEVTLPSGCRFVLFVDWTPELVAEFAVLLEATR